VNNADTVKRLWLETACSKEGRRLAKGMLQDRHFTLLFFDYGETGHVAFTSTLNGAQRVEVFAALLESWRTGTPRVGVIKDGCTREEFSLEHAEKLSAEVQCPPGVGFALLVGYGATYYVATAEREDVARLLAIELLPIWQKGASDDERDN
jgi:hypothetical protein